MSQLALRGAQRLTLGRHLRAWIVKKNLALVLKRVSFEAQ